MKFAPGQLVKLIGEGLGVTWEFWHKPGCLSTVCDCTTSWAPQRSIMVREGALIRVIRKCSFPAHWVETLDGDTRRMLSNHLMVPVSALVLLAQQCD